MSGTVTETLVPGKFLCVMVHLLLIIVIYYLRDNNIYAGVKSTVASDDDDYKSAEAVLLVSLAFTTICLAFELIIIVIGLTIYFDTLSATSIFLHALGILFSIWFVLLYWPYWIYWYIWLFTSFIPFFFEFMTVLTARIFFLYKY
ncbi:unnamed protein product [Blepharisma stoltei]|uniref:Transmembrane protein 107 n=1 Tax=Blepharisma stoltei TaxID=1481888 RepID=A0AAU9IQS4_9CILI|nr:unnamed protein product [Blepharisma stoltei]